MKRLYCVACAAAVALCLCATSCSKDEEPTTQQGQTVDPNQPVPDPEGTVTMNMLKGDSKSATCLDSSIYIDEALNFIGYHFLFMDLGEMKGVGNIDITQFAITNPGSSCAVLEKHGYIVTYMDNKETFPSGATAYWAHTTYGIYVTQYLTSGGTVTGAIVKYIQPKNMLEKLVAEYKADQSAFYEKYKKEFKNGEMEIFNKDKEIYLRYRQVFVFWFENESK